jgi:SAM-dependent methyltransferase
VHEILDHLDESAIVLDIGSGPGSFPDSATRARVFRVDLNRPGRPPQRFAQADALALPFRTATFDAVILNHSLEHFPNWRLSLQEIGRVVKKDGAAYIAVPDASTFSDRLYRKVFRDRGGHINLFADDAKLAKSLSWYLGLPHVATRVLQTSLVFQNRRNTNNDRARPEMRFLGLPEPLLALTLRIIRTIDKHRQTRLGVYGWAFFFGKLGEPVNPTPRLNVCVRCGQAHPDEYLRALQLLRPTALPWHKYTCPDCGCDNWFVPEIGTKA